MKQFTQNRFLVALVGILLLANLALLLYFFVFKKSEHRSKQPRRPISEFVQKELGFSKEQGEKFQQLRDQHKETVKPLMQEMQKLKDSLFGSLQKPTDDSTVKILADKIGEKQQELELITYRHFQQVRQICNNDQLPKFDSLVHKMITRGPGKKNGGDKKRP
jgi:periplasmic protein CpxP/Spy